MFYACLADFMLGEYHLCIVDNTFSGKSGDKSSNPVHISIHLSFMLYNTEYRARRSSRKKDEFITTQELKIMEYQNMKRAEQ
jgi:hypothetical protein